MKDLTIATIGEKLLIKYDGVAVMIDFAQLNPSAPPVAAAGCGVRVVVKPN